MKKFTVLKTLTLLAVMMVCLGLAGCKAEDNTATITTESELTSVADYFNTYEVLSYCNYEKGCVYVFDDGSENGLAIAAFLDEEQLDRIADLDFFSDTYTEDMTAIVEEATQYTVTALDDYVPDMSDFDKYIGQKVEVMMDDGFYETGSCISENQSFLYLNNDEYEFQVDVEEQIDQDQDMTEDFEKTLTVKSLTFINWGSDFYESLFD